jgi:hypothetical protein
MIGTTSPRHTTIEYRTGPEWRSTQAGLPIPHALQPTPLVVPSIIKPRDPLSDFHRGICRDPSSFTALKEDKQWDAWQCSTIAQARAQDISEVLDATYVPNTPAAIELFLEKQKFIYAVFEKTLLTDKGKALV